jgi:integrase
MIMNKELKDLLDNLKIKLTDKGLQSLIKLSNPVRFRVESAGPGVYFRVTNAGSAFWVYRYNIKDKRKEVTIGRYGKPPVGITLKQIADDAAELRKLVKENQDPQVQKSRSPLFKIETVDELAEDWLKECDKRLKYPNIPRRVYFKDISPAIGQLNIEDVRKPDIYQQIRVIRDSGRPTIASDALGYCKQLFDHAETIGLIELNPASSIMPGKLNLKEKPRKRTLDLDEIKHFFEVIKANKDQFVIDNYYACIILLCLGVRKSELLAAPWSEFDLDKREWHLPEERSKTDAPIVYPLDDFLIDIFQKLKWRSGDSEYVFPNRRASKRFKHISPDTLNAAIGKLFKEKKLDIPHFTIHDFRRTFRTRLTKLKVQPHIAEKCLNHQLPKIMAIYDTGDYFDERKEAHELVIKQLKDLF